MKLREKLFKNNLLKVGYKEEQANAILKVISIYPKSINYMTTDLSAEQIDQIGEFFKYEDAPSIMHIANLEPKKRIMMVEAYNKFTKLKENNYTRTFRLVYDVACEYDVHVLKTIIDKSICETPDYEFLNMVRNTMESNQSLLDLDCFKDLTKENIKK